MPTSPITEGFLTEKEYQQLLLDEEVLRETLEEQARAKKELDERIKKEQAEDELFRLLYVGVLFMASGNNDRDVEDTLSKFLQMGTVVEYQNEFEMLINRVTGISESLLKTFYISGIKPTLQCALLRSNPTTLGEAFSLALAIEACFTDLQLWEMLRSNPTTLGETFFKARIIEARFEDERFTTTIAKANDLNTGHLNDKYIKKKKMEAVIQRRLWDPKIKSVFQDNTLRASCPLLSVISLARCSITDSGLEILTNLCKSLEEVNLAWCTNIIDLGIWSLDQNSHQLRSLNITCCSKIVGFTFQGFSPTVAYLDAANCVLGSTGCPLLQEWNLSCCGKIKISGWESIGSYCQNLKILHVSYCFELCDRGLLALGNGCKRLSVIYLKDCLKLTTSGLHLFKVHREDVEIKEEVRLTEISPNAEFTFDDAEIASDDAEFVSDDAEFISDGAEFVLDGEQEFKRF
ncbi:leucine-rich repeat domain, L domain-like protein [Tanacetum coccineum]